MAEIVIEKLEPENEGGISARTREITTNEMPETGVSAAVSLPPAPAEQEDAPAVQEIPAGHIMVVGALRFTRPVTAETPVACDAPLRLL